MAKATVTFEYDTSEFMLNYPEAFTDLPLASLKKLFTMMVKGNYHVANQDAIRVTSAQLEDLVDTLNLDWREKSIEFSREYVDADYHYGRKVDSAAKRKAEARNKKLERAVKSAKSKYERAVKLNGMFDDIRANYET